MEPVEVKGQNGTLIFDGQSVVIVRKGFLTRATVGKGEKRIPLSAIGAVQFKPAGPLVNGFIQFSPLGGNEKRSAFGAQTASAAKDENSVVFAYSQRHAFAELREHIESALLAREAMPPPMGGVSPEGVTEQIKQLLELKELGAITDREFEAKKAELLRRFG